MTAEEHTQVWDAAVNNTVECMLVIIDKLYDTTCDRYSKVAYMQSARNELIMCRQAVKTLIGGEKN